MDRYDLDGDPFGFSAGPPGRSPFPPGLARGAENLLVKAADAWDNAQHDRATRLLDRAAALPFDRREGLWPGLAAAHMLLFELLVHTLETGDPKAWFAAVEATYAATEDVERAALGRAVGTVIADWHLEPGLDRRLRTLVRPARDEVEPSYDAGLDPALLRPLTESTLRLAVRLSDELAARDLCSHLAPEYW